jgi:hypothetical protein
MLALELARGMIEAQPGTSRATDAVSRSDLNGREWGMLKVLSRSNRARRNVVPESQRGLELARRLLPDYRFNITRENPRLN